MPKERKPPEEPAGVPAWMATFSDLVTLLLTFFVMLMSMASFDDAAKVDAVLKSLHEQLGADGFDPQTLGSGELKAMSPSVSADVASSPMLAKLAAAFRLEMSNQPIHIEQEEAQLRIDLPNGAFFKTGSHQVHPAGYGLLAEVADILASEPGVTVDVVGFAEPSESEAPELLATKRGVAVVSRLRTKVAGERLSVTAFDPPAVDPTDRTAGWRRRIALVLRTTAVSSRAPLQDIQDREDSDAGRR
ncbi:MAG: flagellar motor protein MotB [Myxococcota bacterium]